jgi:hypothetical protein
VNQPPIDLFHQIILHLSVNPVILSVFFVRVPLLEIALFVKKATFRLAQKLVNHAIILVILAQMEAMPIV